jgi:PAS domain S-box-containing protein
MTKRLKGDMPRKFGLDLVGDVPWGAHLCQFYQTKEDLIDILVPYFAEGLRGNEFCMWVTSPPLEVEEAKTALREVIPDLDLYLQKGQIEIISYKEWYLLGGTFDSDRVLRGWVEKEKTALSRGFSGLRLSGNTFWLERNCWKAFTAYEEEVNNSIGKYRMIAVCTYSLDKCNVNEIIDVIKNHQFALIKRRGRWELIESAEKRKIAEDLRKTEKKFTALYNSMTEGVALHDVVYDISGKAVDYVITDVNPSFERITGLSKKQAVGKKASELYGTGEPPYLDVYAKVASSGKPAWFETYFSPMQKHFSISVFSPSKGKFNTVIYNITESKIAEEARRKSEERYRSYIEVTGELGWITNAKGEVVEDIPSWRNFTGQTFEEVKGFGWSKALHPDDREDTLRVWKQATLEKSKYEVEYRVRRHDGVYRYFMARSVPVFNNDGTIREWIGTCIDITERKQTEQAILRAKTEWERTFDSVPDLIAILDAQHRIVRVNRAMAKRLGVPPEQCIGLKCHECVHGTGVPPESCPHVQTLRDGKEHTAEVHEDRLGGDFLVSTTPLSDERGQMIGSVHVARDITEHKKKEKILREQSLVISSASDAIFSTDNSFTIKSWNKAAEKIFGWKTEEVIGKASTKIFDAVYPTLDGITREQALEQLMNEGFWKGEIIYHKKDGSPIPVLSSASLVKDENGSVTGVVAVIHDITARKRREDALRETQRDLNRAQAVAKTGSWRLDTRQDILLWSDETYHMFGIPKGTPLTYETFLGTVHPEDKEYVNAKWNAALHGKPYDIEHRIIVEGEVKWVREKAELEFDKDGTLTGGFGTVQEITELKEMQEKLEEYSKHLEDLVEEKTKQLKDAERMATIGETAGMIGHDIRNPLQTIIGELYLSKDYLHSLPESETKKELADSMRVIEEQATYINKIVTDLQDYAKPLSPYIENADLEEIAASMLSTMEIPENIEVTYSVEEGFPNLKTDCSYMKRILTNLTANAVQAMPNGGKLTISAYCRGNRAFICVEDTGEGIPEEAKNKLFKPLFTTKAKGQGFGLAVVKKLTDALNGAIAFESEEGKGTKFIIEFPKN